MVYMHYSVFYKCSVLIFVISIGFFGNIESCAKMKVQKLKDFSRFRGNIKVRISNKIFKSKVKRDKKTYQL